MIQPIPKAAMPVVNVLRRDVKRPRKLPSYFVPPESLVRALRWRMKLPSSGCLACPMGLHPLATNSAPGSRASFPVASNRAVRKFGTWWDSIERDDRRAAVDAIWPRAKP